MYYELSKQVIENGEKRFHRLDLEHSNKISIAPREYDAYKSHYAFPASIKDYALQLYPEGKPKPSVSWVAGYTGPLICEVLFIDIDFKDKENARKACREIVRLLIRQYHVKPETLEIYFSGSKGFHIGIPVELFHYREEREDWPTASKKFIWKLIGVLFEGKFTPERLGIDDAIYRPVQPFRLPNSLNTKSGLYKVLIEWLDFAKMEDIYPVLDYAKEPADILPNYDAKTLKQNNGLSELFSGCLSNDLPQGSINTPGAEKKYLEPLGRDGDGRHVATLSRANYIFAHGFPYEPGLQILKTMNLSGGEPVKESDLEKICRDAYHHQQKKQVVKVKEESAHTMDFMEAIRESLRYLSQPYKKLQCLFDEIDETQNSRYKGKLALFIGSAGTMKSYGAQNVVAQNLVSETASVFLSSMEMGLEASTMRLVDVLNQSDLLKDQPQSPSSLLEEFATQSLNKAISWAEDNYLKYANHLTIDTKGFRTVEDYDRLLAETEKRTGEKQDILIVDGLSLMGGRGDEMEKYSTNSAALKQLAKEHDVFVILICHTNKGANPYTRNSINLIRSSGKLIDNMDFCLCFSKLISRESTKSNIIAAPGKGHVYYYNKRGRGEERNFIFDIHRTTSQITLSDDGPQMFLTEDQLTEKDESESPKPNFKS